MYPPEKHFEEMKRTAKLFEPFSHPKIPDDPDISWLKHREIYVDGYPLIVHYSHNDHGDIFLKTITIGCKHVIALPFFLICKIARKYLGDDGKLIYYEHVRGGRKIYSWVQITQEGKPLLESNLEKDNYDGFEFYRGVVSEKSAI